MAATTLSLNIADPTVTITSGGTPGAKAVTVIIDRSKIDKSGDVYVALRRAAEAYTDAYPPAQS